MKRKFLTAGREKWLRYLAHSLALFLTVESIRLIYAKIRVIGF